MSDLNLSGKKIGFGITGSHCTLDRVMPVLEEVVESGADVTPIISEAILNRDTKFGPADKWLKKDTGYNPEAIDKVGC